MEATRKGIGAEFEVSDGPSERTFVAKITSSATDRDDEVLLPDGMRTDDFERNPVLFWNHDYSLPPIGNVRNLKRQKDHWLAEGVFASRPGSHPENAEWFPDTVHDLMRQNVIRGVSVGLKPDRVRRASTKDKETFGEGVERVVAQWDLLELSVAPLPSNPEALVQAVSKGILSRKTCSDLFPGTTLEPKRRKSVIWVPAAPVRKRKAKVPIDKQIADGVGKELRITIDRARGRIYG